jgi:hypothetical protein
MGHYYERLSALDASFLGIETENCHMHIAAVLIFDGAQLMEPHGRLDAERIRAYVESRLHGIPRYRQRLAWIPVERHPVWMDDPCFNVFYHVRHTALPRPGEERQLKRLCGRILSQKLDPTKPLWELWIVEGLRDERFALVLVVGGAMPASDTPLNPRIGPHRRFDWLRVEPTPAAPISGVWRNGSVRLAQ